jgi:hypothetical protein
MAASDGRRDALAERGHHAAGDENEGSHGEARFRKGIVYRLAVASATARAQALDPGSSPAGRRDVIPTWAAAGRAATTVHQPRDRHARLDPVAGATHPLRAHSEPGTDPDSLDLVWWLVPQFWEASLARQKEISPETRAEIIRLFTENVVVAAVKGRMGTLRVESFLDDDAIRESLRLVDSRGNRHAPVPAAEVDSALRAMLGALQPMLAGVIGQLGDNLNFYVFPARSEDGARPFDPIGQGRVMIELDGLSYEFRLPLGSLLNPRFDPDTGEEFPGKYLYSPYSGRRLQSSSP